MISQWYEPETGSAAHPTAIARALVARGHEVKVLTGFPSYPLGRVYDGYRMSLRAHEERDGVSLLRVPDSPSHDNSGLRRAMSLTSFAASATAQVGWLRDVDVCLTYLTPATVGTAAMSLRRLWRVPYVLYVQDLWPETVTASGFIGNQRVTAGVERSLHAYLRRLYGGADGIAGISPSMTAALAGRGAKVSPVSIPNWIDEEIFRPAPPASPRVLDDRRWIMYAGGIGDVQALGAAVRAIGLLGERTDIALAFVGDGVAVPGLRRLADELGVSNRVRFLGSYPMEQMPALMSEAAAQLVSLQDLPLFRGTVPSKVQASMAAGCPIVCAVAGDAAQIVAEAEAGFVATPEVPESLANAFAAMADLSASERAVMGKRARLYYLENLSAGSGAASLDNLLETAQSRAAR